VKRAAEKRGWKGALKSRKPVVDIAPGRLYFYRAAME
jgi:hypothetical protein